MDLSESHHKVVSELVTSSAGDPTTADFSLPANKETATDEILSTDEPRSVMPVAAEDAVSAVEAETVNRDGVETVDELTVPLAPSSPASDSREFLSGLSQISSTVQGFETLRLEILSRLKTTDRMNDDEHSTAAGEAVVIRRLLESLESGIEEIQANIVNVCITFVHRLQTSRFSIYQFSKLSHNFSEYQIVSSTCK